MVDALLGASRSARDQFRRFHSGCQIHLRPGRGTRQARAVPGRCEESCAWFWTTPIIETSTRIISDSAFGCAGQRCLAVSVAVTVGDAQSNFKDSIAGTPQINKVGNGLDEAVQMGPVITSESKARIENLSVRARAMERKCYSMAERERKLRFR